MTFRPWITLAGIISILAGAFSPDVPTGKMGVLACAMVLIVAVACREAPP